VPNAIVAEGLKGNSGTNTALDGLDLGRTNGDAVNNLLVIVLMSLTGLGNAMRRPDPDVWPLQNPVLASFLWVALILAIFVPMAIHRYQKAVSQ
jgi:hypothetical protein